MRGAESGDAAQFVGRPDASHGVVRVAEQQHGGLFEGKGIGQRLPIDRIVERAAVIGRKKQRHLDRLASGIAHEVEEDVIDRSEQHHVVTRLTYRLERRSDGRHHADGVENLVAADVPAVARGEPVDDGLVVGIGHHRVAVASMCGATHDGLLHARRSGEIHVGHPKRQHVRRGTFIPLHAACVAAVDDVVEVCHK